MKERNKQETTYSIRIPKDLKEYVNKRAKETYRSINTYLIDIILKDKKEYEQKTNK